MRFSGTALSGCTYGPCSLISRFFLNLRSVFYYERSNGHPTPFALDNVRPLLDQIHRVEITTNLYLDSTEEGYVSEMVDGVDTQLELRTRDKEACCETVMAEGS